MKEFAVWEVKYGNGVLLILALFISSIIMCWCCIGLSLVCVCFKQVIKISIYVSQKTVKIDVKMTVIFFA